MKKIVLPLLACISVVSVMIFQAYTPELSFPDRPNIALVGIPGWESVPLGPSEMELKGLPADTIIEKCRYQRDDGAWFVLSLVVGGRNKLSIHRPELCLPSQGFQMTEPRTVKVDGRDWRFITLETNDGAKCGFAYTFANQEGFRTASHVARVLRDLWDRSFLLRNDRWAMITVFSSSADEASLRFAAGRVERMFEEGARR